MSDKPKAIGVAVPRSMVGFKDDGKRCQSGIVKSASDGMPVPEQCPNEGSVIVVAKSGLFSGQKTRLCQSCLDMLRETKAVEEFEVIPVAQPTEPALSTPRPKHSLINVRSCGDPERDAKMNSLAMELSVLTTKYDGVLYAAFLTADGSLSNIALMSREAGVTGEVALHCLEEAHAGIHKVMEDMIADMECEAEGKPKPHSNLVN